MGDQFWQNLKTSSHLGNGIAVLAVVFLVIATLQFLFDPTSRKRTVTAVRLLVVAYIGLAVAAYLYGSEGIAQRPIGDKTPLPLDLRIVRDLSEMLLGTAIVLMAAVIFFNTTARLIRVRVPGILQDLVLAGAFIVTNALILMHLETGLSGLIATSAIGTAILGFALQSTFENVMGGVALQMDRTISVGDWIRIDNIEGVVREIRWRQTSIETRDWNTVIIPNSQLMKGVVTILGRRQGAAKQTRRWIRFQIDHGVPTNQVIGVVEAALHEETIPGVATDPPANCILTDVRDAWQTFAVRYWLTDFAKDDPTDSLVRTRVIAALKRAGIEFSYPTQTIRLFSHDEEHHQREAERGMTHRLKAVGSIPLFDPLTENERREVASDLHETPFVRGEVITRQGSRADCLYIIVTGDAEVRVSADGHALSKTVAMLHAGDFFGEMALLTGATRTATVVASTDVMTYRLDKTPFLKIVQHRPAIAEAISHIVAQRKVEQDAVKEHLDAEAQRQRLASAEGDLLKKIRSFFKL